MTAQKNKQKKSVNIIFDDVTFEKLKKEADEIGIKIPQLIKIKLSGKFS